MQRRTLLKSLGAVTVFGTAAVGAGTALSSGPLRRGTVAAKAITGQTSDGPRSVLLAQDGELAVEDEAYADDFESRQAVTIDDATAERLTEDYERVYYTLYVEHIPIKGADGATVSESLAYRTNREAFNSVTVGETTAFRIADSDVPRIESVGKN